MIIFFFKFVWRGVFYFYFIYSFKGEEVFFFEKNLHTLIHSRAEPIEHLEELKNAQEFFEQGCSSLHASLK